MISLKKTSPAFSHPLRRETTYNKGLTQNEGEKLTFEDLGYSPEDIEGLKALRGRSPQVLSACISTPQERRGWLEEVARLGRNIQNG